MSPDKNIFQKDCPSLFHPGVLFKRELPCIGAVLALNGPPDLLVVDGYATSTPTADQASARMPRTHFNLPAIGVAKTPFRAATHAIEVIRGTATRPSTSQPPAALGIDEAARTVAGMAGPHRLPSVLARVDRLARGRAQPVVVRGTS